MNTPEETSEKEEQIQQEIDEFTAFFEEFYDSRCEIFKKELLAIIDNEKIVNSENGEPGKKLSMERIEELINSVLTGEQEYQIKMLFQQLNYYQNSMDEATQDQDKSQQLLRRINELESELENEHSLTQCLQLENQKINKTLQESRANHDEVLTIKDSQILVSERQTEQEQGRLQQFEEELGAQQEMIREKDERIKEMEEDFQLMKSEVKRLQGQGDDYRGGGEGVEQALKECEGIKQKLEEENFQLQDQVTELTEQIQQIVEVEQETNNNILNDIKNKSKQKISQYKKKILNLKQLLEEKTEQHDEMVSKVKENNVIQGSMFSQVQNNLQIIKSEWEKKYKELEVQSQREIMEQQAFFEENIKNMKDDYEQMMNKRAQEIYQEATQEFSEKILEEQENSFQLSEKFKDLSDQYILKSTHSEILDTRAKTLKTENEKTINALSDEYQQLITEERNIIVKEKTEEFESLLDIMKDTNNQLNKTNQIQSQELEKQRKEIQTLKRNSKGTEEKLLESRQNCSIISKNLLAQLEESHTNLDKLKTIVEEYQDQTKSLENEKQTTINRLIPLEKYEKQRLKTISALKKEQTRLKIQLENKEAQIETQQAELSATENKSEELIEQIEQLNTLVEESEQNKQQESSSLLTNIHQLEEEKIEIERNFKSQIAEIEQINHDQQNQLHSQAQKIHDLNQSNQKILSQNEETKRQNNENQNEITQKHKALGQLQQSIEGFKWQKRHLQHSIQENLTSEVTIIRENFLNLKQQVKGDLRVCKSFINKLIQEIIRTCGNIMKRQEMSLKNEIGIAYERKVQDLKIRLREAEQTYSEQVLKTEYEQTNRLQSSARKLTQQEKQVKTCEKELKMNETQIKEAGLVNHQLQVENQQLEEDKSRIQALLQRKLEEFSEFHIQVQQQIHQLKLDNEQLVNSVTSKIQGKYQDELTDLQNTVSQLKKKHKIVLKALSQEIEDIQHQFKTDLRKEVQRNKQTTEQLQEKITTASRKKQQTITENEQLIKELSETSQNYQRLQQENSLTSMKFKEKFSSFKEMVDQDGAKYIKLKHQTNAQIQSLQVQNTSLLNDLKKKNRILKKIELSGTRRTMVKQDANKEVKSTIKRKINRQYNQNSAHIENKEKEVEELTQFIDDYYRKRDSRKSAQSHKTKNEKRPKNSKYY